jgi:Ca-activated chloride channel family protein
MLLLLLVVPALGAGYLSLADRRSKRQSALGSMGVLRTRSGKPIGRLRHVPPAVFLIGIAVLAFGLARPQMTVKLPRRQGTVILAFDASSSMTAGDVKPSRLEAAKKAARTFVADQPSSIRIGVVAFNDAGFVLQRPTKVKQDALAAIARLSPGGATSLGGAILTSLNSIAGKPIPVDAQALQDGTPQTGIPFLGSAVVLLLTDGENTSRPDPIATADIAAQAGVRIDPIGLGTLEGAVVTIDGFSVATSLDENLLKQIATTSNGTYFRAKDAASLEKVYGSVDLKLTLAGSKKEVTGLFGAAGGLLFLFGGILSMRWFGRVP